MRTPSLRDTILGMTPGQVVMADTLLRRFPDGDVCSEIKKHQRLCQDPVLSARMDTAVLLVRAAYPDQFRLTKSQVRALRAELHACHDGEPSPNDKDL